MERSLLENVFVFALNMTAWMWGVVTFLPWYYMSGKKKYRFSDKIQAKPTSNVPGSPYRCVESFDNLTTTPYDGVHTLDRLFSRSASLYPYRKCLGTRQILREEDETQSNGRVFKKFVGGEYNWLTYTEVDTRAKNFGNGLAVLGQCPRENIVIFADTKADWMIALQGCFANNFPVATVYSTLGEEAFVHGINETQVRFIITDGSLLRRLEKVIDQLLMVEHIIYFGNAIRKMDLIGFPRRVRVQSMKEVEEIGSAPVNKLRQRTRPCGSDTAVIMYTSGSTGLPKGVVISHENLVAAVAGISARIQPAFSEKDVYVGYLPLAHVLELVAENGILASGASIGYSSPLTLSDQSSKVKRGSHGDLTVLQPTLMAAVPAIMDRIRQGVLDKVKDGPRLLQLFFAFAYNYKLQQVKQGYDTPLLNRFIFGKIRKMLGGRVREIVSGGAPLSPDTQYFMNVCFCCPVGQGYGLTETCGGGTVCNVSDRTTGRVGPPISCSEIKLVSWEEGFYTIQDKPFPRGEILIGGANVSMGYYKNPKKTAEDFQVDKYGKRWFRTGDIGEFQSDGCLKIIDRKKDLVKLQFGEYVSLGKVESSLAISQYVENICVYAESSKTYTICLVVPRQKNLNTLAASLSVDTGHWEAVCQNQAVKEAVMKDLQSVGKACKLQKFEIPHKVTLVTEQWTPETELVTTALKLKRNNIYAFYKQALRHMYSS